MPRSSGGLPGALRVWTDLPVCLLGHLASTLATFRLLASGVTPQLLLAWRHPSGSHVTRTVLTQIFLVMLPGVVPAAETPSLSWRTRQPASSCHLVGDMATGSHWCSALPPTHGPILGSGTLLSWVSGRQGGGRGPGVQGHPGSPCEAWPQQGQAEEATPILSCLSGPFLRTLNPVTQTVF